MSKSKNIDFDLIKKKVLVAEFMGAKVTQEYLVNEKLYPDQDGLLFYFSENSPSLYRNMSSVEIKYDTSWDWIMNVWIKFRNLNIQNEQYDKFLAEIVNLFLSPDKPYPIFEKLCESISWYLKINNKNE